MIVHKFSGTEGTDSDEDNDKETPYCKTAILLTPSLSKSLDGLLYGNRYLGV